MSTLTTDHEVIDGEDPRFLEPLTGMQFARQFKSAEIKPSTISTLRAYGKLAGIRLTLDDPHWVFQPKYRQDEILFLVRGPNGEIVSHFFARALTQFSKE